MLWPKWSKWWTNLRASWRAGTRQRAMIWARDRQLWNLKGFVVAISPKFLRSKCWYNRHLSNESSSKRKPRQLRALRKILGMIFWRKSLSATSPSSSSFTQIERRWQGPVKTRHLDSNYCTSSHQSNMEIRRVKNLRTKKKLTCPNQLT